MTLFFVRHGQTDLNRDRRFRGFSDAPLNGQGRLEARGAAALLSLENIEELRTSPVRRAMETANIIGDRLALQPIVDERFTDVDYGEWQGMTVEEVAKKFGSDMLQEWRHHPDSFTFPGGDSMAGVRLRLGAGMVELAKESPGKRVAVISHLAVLKLCFIAALDLPFDYFWRLELDNGAVSSFEFTGANAFVLGTWNRSISADETV
jgi:broad specificity phosphatase PhoE